jgi:hypothetical protein
MTAGDPDGDPAVSADDRRAHARIEAALRQVGGELTPPVGWQNRVLAAGAAAPRRRWWWLAAPGMLSAALVLTYVFWPRVDPPDRAGPPVIALKTIEGTAIMRGSSAAIGSVVRARGTGGEPERALWVFRRSTLIATCPGDPRCVARDGWELDVELTAPELHRFVYVTSRQPLAAPDKSYDLAMATAMDAGATTSVDTIDVH